MKKIFLLLASIAFLFTGGVSRAFAGAVSEELAAAVSSIRVDENSVSSEYCRIARVVWTGAHTAFDETQMAAVLGEPCESWHGAASRLQRYYEDHGFIAAQVMGRVVVDSEVEEAVHPVATLMVELRRGAGYVWAPAENRDSSGARPEVFRRLSGLFPGDPVSLTDLDRSERKLARVGYFEKTAPVRLYRDPARNRIVPLFSMRKANVSEAEGVLTYSSDENVWEGQIDVNLYNIAGTARDLRLEGFTGESSRHLVGSYKEPWILGTAWNVVLRGRFDEETLETSVEDSAGHPTGEIRETVEKTVMGEVGVTRDIGFDLSVGVYLGVSEDDKHSSLEISYVSLDRFALPRSGWRVEGTVSYKMDRPEALDDFLDAEARMQTYIPLYRNILSRFTGAAGGIFPTDASLKRADLFALGGLDNFKGMGYHSVRSRAYGFSEAALLWQDGYDLSIEAFFQPGMFRRLAPGHGWAREYNYGAGFTQYRGNWSVNLYYALRNGCDYLEGILGFGIKTLF